MRENSHPRRNKQFSNKIEITGNYENFEIIKCAVAFGSWRSSKFHNIRESFIIDDSCPYMLFDAISTNKRDRAVLKADLELL